MAICLPDAPVFAEVAGAGAGVFIHIASQRLVEANEKFCINAKKNGGNNADIYFER